MVFPPARVLGLPCPSVDDARPSLSTDTTVSNCSRYKSEALGVDPLYEPSANPRKTLKTCLWKLAFRSDYGSQERTGRTPHISKLSTYETLAFG